MKKTFSILIPAFNVELYIDKCLKGVIDQTYNDFEVIIIDDGSTDNTLNICNYYAKLDKRINIIHQDNHGIIYTRNKLISLARGEWIVFIDADDNVSSNYLEYLLLAATNKDIDVIVCDYIRLEKDNRLYPVITPFKGKTDYLKKLLSWRKINTALWAKTFKKSLVDKHNIKFTDNIVLGEDLCFMSQLFYYANDIQYLPKTLYVWNRNNAGSITSDKNNYKDLVLLYKKIFDFYKTKNDFKKYEKVISITFLQLMLYLQIYRNYDITEIFNYRININILPLWYKFKLYLFRHKLYNIIKITNKILG